MGQSPLPADDALPPGHPPIDGMMAPSVDPTRSPSDDATLPSGTVVVQANGPADVVAGLQTFLIQWHQDAKGAEKQVRATASLDTSGSTTFTGLSTESSYGVVIEHEGVSYASPAFRVGPRGGKRVPIRVYPITTNIDEALVGVRVVMYLEPRDQHIHAEQLLQFVNLSQWTWRTPTVPIRLPPEAVAVIDDTQSGPVHIEVVPEHGVVMQGVVPPGTTDVVFRARIPYPNKDRLDLSLGLPPRVGAVRIMAGLGPGLGLQVAGFPQPSTSLDEKGRRLLSTELAVPAGADQIERVSVSITGFPGRNLISTIGIGLTLALIVAGLVITTADRRRSKNNRLSDRESLLEQFLLLETDLKKGKLRRSQYETNRQRLLELLKERLRDERNSSDVAVVESVGDKP
jgi:hypothetical protein